MVGLIAALNITAKGLSILGPQLGAGLTALVTGLALAGAEAIATSPALGAIGLRYTIRRGRRGQL